MVVNLDVAVAEIVLRSWEDLSTMNAAIDFENFFPPGLSSHSEKR